MYPENCIRNAQASPFESLEHMKTEGPRDMVTGAVSGGVGGKAPGGACGARLRVLAVIPGEAETPVMPFAKRQVASLRRAGITVHSFFLASRTSPARLISEYARLRREIRSFRPDLVHAHYGTMTAFLCGVATRLPLVVTFRGSDLNPCPGVPPIVSLLGRFLSQLSALRARRIICVSEGLKARLWWKGRRATVIPSGVDADLFHPVSQAEARSRLAWPLERRVVVFNAGANPAGKRLDLAQAAVATARGILGDVDLFVLNGLVDPDLIPTILNAADCLILTSDHEGSPNVVKEALACSLPVVSFDVGDVREYLAEVPACSIVERDPAHLGRTVAAVLRDRTRTGEGALPKRFFADAVVEEIVRVYLEVVPGTTPRQTRETRNRPGDSLS
jgi:glycosyltransferase involved in cell wall biosynthesis